MRSHGTGESVPPGISKQVSLAREVIERHLASTWTAVHLMDEC